MKLEKAEVILSRRFIELAKSAYHKGICIYTDFLNLNEISIFHSMVKELPPIPYSMYGGYEGAERVKICFHGNLESRVTDITGSEEANISDFPIVCLYIKPTNEKFAQELDHRDYLGAIMNLGTNRNKIGDILIQGKEAYCYCDDMINEYITMNLERIRHTNVSVKLAKENAAVAEQNYKEVTGSVSSFRLDAMIALAFHTSRSSITGLIEGEKVYVNARIVTSNSHVLKEGDVVSVRGFGKFRFLSQGNMTKKGRIYANLLIYA
jgi:RNA-binding protein YlmH